MAIKFVKTEILSSRDGVSFSESQKIESEEVTEARRLNRDGGKSLYAQLEEQKEKQQDHYDETTKLIFAPPRGLDDEDVAFFLSEERRRKKTREQRDRDELDAFGAARADYDGVAKAKKDTVVVVDAEDHTATEATATEEGPPVKLRRKIKVDEERKEETRTDDDDAKTQPSGLAALLGAYDDDDDDDD
eukprot:CAMPEP_0118896838 /NCGR_PEP_ID=MMETSP1166-20130328/4509_1 /TAXON_ID=1104430 /ORGANISM="Chrysoreinhardia sp, Strain CCMP3193" /LENGTH=188 /DNA_ID=CAMNT_0006835897 /DNA_START=11 /DNA_END=577 /DNA_ORIENTATION=+